MEGGWGEWIGSPNNLFQFLIFENFYQWKENYSPIKFPKIFIDVKSVGWTIVIEFIK